MQYKSLLAMATFAITALAQNQTAELLSVVSVLQTALPSSLVREFLTNSAAVASEISSDFIAGNPPAWFTALPADVRTYIGAWAPSATATATGSGAPFPSANSTGNATASSRSKTSKTTRLTSSTSTSTSTEGGSLSASAEGSSSSSTGAASVPSAVYGMGLAGAVGLVGVLAL